MTTLYSLLECGTNLLSVLLIFTNASKGAMNVKQIAWECSGPPVGSYVLKACIGRVAYESTLMSLQQNGQTRPH